MFFKNKNKKNEKINFHYKPYRKNQLEKEVREKYLKKAKELAEVFKSIPEGSHFKNIADCMEQYPEGVFLTELDGKEVLHIYVASPEGSRVRFGQEGDLYVNKDTLLQIDFHKPTDTDEKPEYERVYNQLIRDMLENKIDYEYASASYISKHYHISLKDARKIRDRMSLKDAYKFGNKWRF